MDCLHPTEIKRTSSRRGSKCFRHRYIYDHAHHVLLNPLRIYTINKRLNNQNRPAPSIHLSIHPSTYLTPTYTSRNPKFLFTAKNVKLHSCLTFDSVGFTPAGGGNAPSGVNRKSPSSYTQLQTSELRMSEFVSRVSQRWL